MSDDGLTQEQFDAWPDCPIPGCPNKICLSLNSKYCHPHTKELIVDDSEMLEFQRLPMTGAEHKFNNIVEYCIEQIEKNLSRELRDIGRY